MDNWTIKYFDDLFYITALKPNFERGEREIEMLCKLIEIKENAKILDLCCGIGRHAIPLAMRGYDLVGIDFNSKYLSTAQKLSEEKKLSISWINENMYNIQFKEEFDMILNMWTSFGFSENDKEDYMIIESIFNSLKQGGLFVLEILNRDNVIKYFRPHRWRKVENETPTFVLEKSYFDLMNSRLDSDWFYIKGDEVVQKRSSIRIYSIHELIALLKNAGFINTKLYCFDGHLSNLLENKPDAKRILLIAEK